MAPDPTPRHGIPKIDATDSPDVAGDVNSILDDLDSKLVIDSQGPSLPAPGKAGRRFFTDDLPPGGGSGAEIRRRTHIDLGSSWKKISPPDDGSVTQAKIANNSIPISTPAVLEPTFFSPAPPFVNHHSSSGACYWYRDPYGYIYLEGAVKSDSYGSLTLVELGSGGGAPPASAENRYWDLWVPGSILVSNTKIRINYTSSTGIVGLGMIRYRSA